MRESVKSAILVIDQGTTGTQVSLVDTTTGDLIKFLDKEHRQYYPKPGWVEHDAEEIWCNTESLIKNLLAKSKAKILGVGLTNQRETLVAWDAKTSKPLTKAIVWQCRRTAPLCEKLKSSEPHLEPELKQITGLVLDPYFSASKIKWMLQHSPSVAKAAQSGRLRVGTIDSFLIWKLTQGRSFITDVTNASRTLLMDIKTLSWSSRALEIFGIDSEFEKCLARITPSSGKLAEISGFKDLDGVPITGVAGDQQAALFGQACFTKGEAKLTFGTGSFILVNSGLEPKISSTGMLTTLAWQIEGQKPVYALEGGAFICGALVQWFRDELKWIKKSSEIEVLARKAKAHSDRLLPEQSVFVIPAFAGLGAPFWKPQARGAIFGLTRGVGQAEIALAGLEGLAIQNQLILQSMAQDLGSGLSKIKADGGAASNDLLMQLQANFSEVEVQRPRNIETTTLGAAYLAGMGLGLWDQSKLKSIWKKDKAFRPEKKSVKYCRQKVKIWRHLAARSEMVFGLTD